MQDVGHLSRAVTRVEPYFSFTGRASRKEYWLAGVLAPLGMYVALVVITSLLSLSAGMLGLAIFGGSADAGAARTVLGTIFGAVFGSVMLVAFVGSIVSAPWLGIATSVRRYHDMRASGWNLLLQLIPLAGIFFWALMAFSPSVDEDNPY